MGGTYTIREVVLILRDIDPRGTQTIDLGSFIQWWCSSSPMSIKLSWYQNILCPCLPLLLPLPLLVMTVRTVHTPVTIYFFDFSFCLLINLSSLFILIPRRLLLKFVLLSSVYCYSALYQHCPILDCSVISSQTSVLANSTSFYTFLSTQKFILLHFYSNVNVTIILSWFLSILLWCTEIWLFFSLPKLYNFSLIYNSLSFLYLSLPSSTFISFSCKHLSVIFICSQCSLCVYVVLSMKTSTQRGWISLYDFLWNYINYLWMWNFEIF